MTTAQERLRQSLRQFLQDAVAAADDFRGNAKTGLLEPGIRDFATDLARLPSARAADLAGAAAATENRYLIREPPTGVDRREAGRALSHEALVETGISGLVLSGDDFDGPTLTIEMMGYMAGPTVPIWDYAIIDASVKLSGPVSVVDGWELATPTTDDLAEMTGVSSAARYAGRPSFDLDLHGGLAMLRRVDPDATPSDGFVFYWNMRPSHALWQPLLVLSLYQNELTQLWAQYVVEPGRRVDVLFDRVYTEPWTPDGVIEIEVVRTGDYRIDRAHEPSFRQFCQLVASMVNAVVVQPEPPTNATRERAARLRRITEHFLTAGEDAHGEGEVLSEFNADAVLHYVVALEAVLAGGESDKSELTRKVVQRAAVLAGEDDAGRLAVAKTVRAAYAARSAYAHGSEPKEIDLPALRQIVRSCVLARLVLGDPTATGTDLGNLADTALFDHACLAEKVRQPMREFWDAVAAG